MMMSFVHLPLLILILCFSTSLNCYEDYCGGQLETTTTPLSACKHSVEHEEWEHKESPDIKQMLQALDCL